MDCIKLTRDKTRIYSIAHDVPGNTGLVSWIRDAILLV